MAVEAIFLNPLPASAVRSKAGKRKYKVKSTKLKGWLSLVKKHGGDLKAAAKERRSRLRGKKASGHSASTSRRGTAKTKSGLAARRAASNAMTKRGGGTMAARKTKRRRRNQAPPMPSWVSKWQKGMDTYLTRKRRKPSRAKAPTFRKVRSKGKKRSFTRQDWTRRLKRGTTKWARRAPKRSFAKRVKAGQRRSAKLRRYAAAANPVHFGDWVSRFTRSTGYVPHFRKRARPMTKKWVKRTAKGARKAGKSRYTVGASSAAAGDRWLSGLSRWGRKESRRVTRRAANPKRRRTMAKKRRTRRSRKSYPIVLRNMMPVARRKKRSYKQRSYRRRRNPVGTTLSAMYATPALKKYLYVTGGVAAGAVAPTLLRKGFEKVGVSLPMWSDSILGVAGAALAGIGTAMVTKDDSKGVLVAAGGVAGVLAGMILRQLMPAAAPAVAGLGQSAEQALQMAVDREMAKAGLSGGMGQFLTPGSAEALPAPDMGQFLTEPELKMDVEETGGAVTAGLSQDDLVEAGGSSSFDGIDGSLF